MNFNDPLLETYVYENTQLLEQLEKMLVESEKERKLVKSQIDEIFRVMHTIKGSSAMMEFEGLTHLAHGMEDVFSKIRENPDMPYEKWDPVLDLLFEAIDFFKAEIEKIQQGLPPDGESKALHEKSVSLMNTLFQADGAEKPAVENNVTAAHGESGHPAEKTEYQDTEPADDKYYHAHIYFDRGSSMETVRAFAVVNSISGMYSQICSIPEDLTRNSDDVISNNGLEIYLASNVSYEALESRLSQTLFMRTMELEELDKVPECFGKKAPAKEAVTRAAAVSTEAVESAQQKSSEPAVPTASAAVEYTARETTPSQAGAALASADADSASKGIKQSFLSVSVAKVDKLMNLVGEIVTTESMVIKNPQVEALKIESFNKQARRLNKLINELQDVVMSVRMVPIAPTFHRMQRIVRDMSKKTGKDVELVLIGENTEVDKNIVDSLVDPLMHLIRNSMDHGIETKEERLAKGKSPIGTIELEARNTGGDIVLMVTDDGRGLSAEKLIQKAIDKGLTTKQPSEISDREAYSFIMMPGFSTNTTITEYSGRGVGMDVVRRNIENIGGSVSIENEEGAGMRITMHLPLTLAIINGMDVAVGEEDYILPVMNIRKFFEPRQYSLIGKPDGSEMVMIGKKCYDMIRLDEAFGVRNSTATADNNVLVMVESERGIVCLLVDKLLGEQQVVIKPLPIFITHLSGRINGISGCTILGNGNISLVADINSLVNSRMGY